MTAIDYKEYARLMAQAWYNMHECVRLNMMNSYNDWNGRYFAMQEALFMLTELQADTNLSRERGECTVTINGHEYTFELNEL